MDADVYVYKIEEQWQMVHIPKKPNGFGIFIIGDVNHFVYEGKSLWTQNQQREAFIEDLLDQGYTIFYSHLYGKHWGSPDALKLALKVYEVSLRYATLNSKVHILAEGMGALTALQLLKEMPDNIRSVALINPCINLSKHIENEKVKKIFFKSLTAEISEAYHIEQETVEEMMYQETVSLADDHTPISIWHHINHLHYPLHDHGRAFEQQAHKKGLPVSLIVHLAEKNVFFSHPIVQFFSDYEQAL